MDRYFIVPFYVACYFFIFFFSTEPIVRWLPRVSCVYSFFFMMRTFFARCDFDYDLGHRLLGLMYGLPWTLLYFQYLCSSLSINTLTRSMSGYRFQQVQSQWYWATTQSEYVSVRMLHSSSALAMYGISTVRKSTNGDDLNICCIFEKNDIVR